MNKLWFIVFLFPFLSVQAQTYGWQDFVQEVQEDEYGDEEDWSEYMEDLARLHSHPMDINTATREDLGQLPMLNEEQIEDIHTYVFLHRGMRSLSELMSIESIDYKTRRWLSLFLYAGQEVFEWQDTVTLSRLMKNGKHELLTRFDIPLYYRAGYSHSPENGGYEGNPLYNKVQYRMQSMNHLQWGVKAEKDQGEPFRHNGGYDSYGAYVLLKDIKCIKRIVIGDYKLGLGEGLIINNGFSYGKSMFTRPSQGIRAHTGMDEVNYLRGMATTLSCHNVDFTLWVSARQFDATLDDDGNAMTLQKSGLHRTVAELDKKNNLNSFLTGADVTWASRGIVFGATGYYQRFNRLLSPEDKGYNHYAARGRQFGVMGVHYGYSRGWFLFSGETAYGTNQKGIATLNKLSFKINPRYTLTAWQRYYDKKYYSFYASALSENTSVQNETGEMLRLDARPLSHWLLTAYADFFYNPWPRYNMTRSSNGQDFMLQNEYEINTHHRLSVRYQIKRKEYSDQMQTHNRLRLQYTALPNAQLRLQTTATMHSVLGKCGFAIGQNVRYTLKNDNWRIAAMLTYFDTPNYDTRVYIYEPTLQSTFSFPFLYGQGLRAVATLRCRLWQRLTLEAKYGVTCYFDRTTQSSGMQEIFSRWKNDVLLQVQVRI